MFPAVAAENNPTGIDLVLALADEIRRCRASVAEKRALREEAEKAELRAQGEVTLAERRLAELIATGACTAKNGCAHGAPSTPASALPEDAPKLWKIAFILLEQPTLDYERTAERIWGPGLDKKTAKNRISSNIAMLKTLTVVERLGKNTFKVNRVKLAEKSGLPVPEVSP